MWNDQKQKKRQLIYNWTMQQNKIQTIVEKLFSIRSREFCKHYGYPCVCIHETHKKTTTKTSSSSKSTAEKEEEKQIWIFQIENRIKFCRRQWFYSYVCHRGRNLRPYRLKRRTYYDSTHSKMKNSSEIDLSNMFVLFVMMTVRPSVGVQCRFVIHKHFVAGIIHAY